MANQPTKYKKFLAGAASATLVATAIVPTALAADATTAATDFSDVAATHTHYAAIMQAVERGLFNGYTDGTFKPENTIDRKGVVKSLANYVVSQSDYKTYEEYITGNKLVDKVTPFTDVPATHGDKELFNASLIVKDSGIFTGSNNNLMPANVITRQQMAKVLVNGFGLKDLAGVESKVTDTDKAQAEYVNFINILSENGVTEVTTYNPTSPVKRGQMASFLNRAYDSAHKVVAPETATKVVSVSATNLKEVTVTFDGAVDKASAENLGSYNLKQDTSNVVLQSARLQADGKSVVLTVGATPLDNQEEYTLTVTNVKTSDKSKTVSVKDFAFTPVDAALPTVEKVEGLGNKAIKVTFSEPVNVNSTVAGTFKLDDKVVSGILSGNGTRTVIIELFTTQTTGKHTLAINNQVEDFAGYNLVATSVDFDVVEDVTAPTVVEVKDVTLESATIVFSEDVKDAEALKGSNYYWMNGTTKHAANAAVEKIDGRTFKLTFSGDHKLPAVATDLYVTNIVDYSANKIAADTKVSISPVIDQTRPEVVSALFADTNDSLKLTFNKNINPATFKTTNVVLKDEDGKVVKDYGYTITEANQASSRTLTVNFSEALEAGTYTFELTGIQDTTTLKNTALPIVETLKVEDVTKPKVTSVTGADNVYYVSFDNAMDISTEASVLNPDNYYVKYVQNGVTKTGKLPASTNLTPVNGDKGVIITLPTSVTSLQEITVQGVKGANGEFLNGFSAKYAVGDATNPITNDFTVTRVNATAKDKVLVKFNQPVNSIDISAFTLTAGGSVTGYDIQTDNTLVELTLSGKLDADAVETLTYTAAAAKSLTGKNVTAASGVDILDSIASSIVRNNAGDVVVGSDDTAGLEVVTAAGVTTVEVNFDEDIDVKNTANLINNFKVYQANGLELEYNKDFTVAQSGDDNGFDLNFATSSYAGVVYITFDNTNGNVVDADASKLNGDANTSLAAKGFNTRTEAAPVVVATTNAGLSALNTALATPGTATVAQYEAAGITGVTTANRAAVNTAVEAAKTAKGSSLTQSEVQSAVNGAVAAQADAATVATAKTNLAVALANPEAATSSATLAATQDTATVAWTSSAAGSIVGATFTTPARTASAQTVTLTATITKGASTATQTYTVTVASNVDTDPVTAGDQFANNTVVKN